MARCRLSEISPEEMEELELQVDSECNVQGGLGIAKVQDTLAYQMLLLPVSLYKASSKLKGVTVLTNVMLCVSASVGLNALSFQLTTYVLADFVS